MALSFASTAPAVEVPFNFAGRAGGGLLPLNGNGNGTPTMPGDSSATGGETGAGLIFNTDTNVLSFSYEFSDLSGGLFDAASGMHLHLAEPGVDPFFETGPIAFNLNSDADPNIMLDNSPIAIGSTSGMVTGTATFSDAQETALFAGRYYLNIHSGGFNGGELRGNLIAVPEPATSLLLASLVSVSGVIRLPRRG